MSHRLIRNDAANRAQMRGSASGSVRGRDMTIDRSAVRDLRAGRAELSRSAVQRAQADRLEVNDSSAAVLASRGSVQARNVRTLLLLAPRVNGNVRTVFDARSIFLFGLGIVLGRRFLQFLRLD